MASILNGMTLSGLIRPFGGTFLVFSDYMRPAVRLAALMKLPVVYVFTHDSILLGEDGPTHQPEAHLAALRAMPNMTVLRPGDARETVAAWRVAIENREGPTALILTRQKLPVLGATAGGAADTGVPRGGYVAREPGGAPASGAPDAILIATGSELALALDAQALLEASGIAVRVVSLPSWELFARQPAAYREAVLPSRGAAPARDRGRVTVRLGALGGRSRRGARPDRLRGVGALPGPREALRLHARERGGEGARAARALIDRGRAYRCGCLPSLLPRRRS